MTKTIKIAIADTWGTTPIHIDVTRVFPNAIFIGHDLEKSYSGDPHPHGVMVASRLLLPLIDKEVEVHLIRYLGSYSETTDRKLFDLIRKIKPDIWQNSWGQSRSLDKRVDDAIAEAWTPWIETEDALRKELGYVISFAAGNMDIGGLAFKDVCYPQRLVENAVIAGAIDRRGRVTDFSSDGNVTCVALGHYVYVMNPYSGKWELASGTSFASPDTAGLYLSLLREEENTVVDYDTFIGWLEVHATIPIEISRVDLPHPQFGWGGVSDAYMRVTKEVDAYRKVNMPKITKKSRLQWLDFANIG